MLPRGIAPLNSLPSVDGRPSADTAVHRWRRVYALGGRGHWPPSAAGECRSRGGGKRGKTTKVFFPLLTPQTFLRTRLPAVARLKSGGPQGRLVLQENALDGSGVFRSANQALCTGWPRTVMRGKPRKLTSGPESVPKSARRTEPSPRFSPFRCATEGSRGAKEGLGESRGGKGTIRCPCPLLSPPPDGGNPPPPGGGHCARSL